MKKKVKKNKFNLKEEYQKSFGYLRDCKYFIYIIVAMFFIFALIGFFVPIPEFISEQLLNLMNELIEKTRGMSGKELIVFIFLNNLQSSFFGMMGGFFIGIFSILTTILNGYLLGFASLIVVGEGGFSVLLKLLPHGIFELPAIFISLGLGLKFGTFIFQNNIWKSFKAFFWNSLRVFAFVVLPLLIIAAIIEGILISQIG